MTTGSAPADPRRGGLFVTDHRFDAHDWPGHPEAAARLIAVRRYLEAEPELGTVARGAAGEVDDDLLGAIHHRDHVVAVERLAASGGGWIDTDTYCTARSYEVARLAVGATIRAVEAVCRREVTWSFAAVRPPGHHATPTRAMGFCLFNNVAVAARAAQRRYGVGRVAIVDIDVHHGNGTQEAFYDDDSVLYCSLHQWPLYPGTGRASERGEGRGEGTTLNLPLSSGTDARGWLSAFDAHVLPALRGFAPELLLVSAGYDAHRADPLASLNLDTATYATVAIRLGELTAEWGGCPMVWVLEGGYDLDALGQSVVATLGALAGVVRPQAARDDAVSRRNRPRAPG